MRILRLILSDFLGLLRVAGPLVALRWLLAIPFRFAQCRRAGNLSPVDRIFGDGPVRVRRNGRSALLTGDCILTGIREIWVRDCYFDHGFLSLDPGNTFVDLGAASGVFTLQAFTAAANIRGVAVEAQPDRCQTIRSVLQSNGTADVIQVLNVFVGNNATLDGSAPTPANTAAAIPLISEEQFIQQTALTRIDLLKCDIEGGEFQLFTPNSPLLAMTRQLAIELHPHAGDAQAFIKWVQSQGFQIRTHVQGPTILLLAKRTDRH